MPFLHPSSQSGGGTNSLALNSQPAQDPYGFASATSFNFGFNQVNTHPNTTQNINTISNQLNTNQTPILQQNSKLTKIVTWRDLLEPEFSIDNLIFLANAISQETRTNFINEFKDRLSGNSKSNKERVKALRSELFKSLCANFNYKPNKNSYLADKTGSQMIEDIHILCNCLHNQQLDIEILDLFGSQDNNKDTNSEANKMCERMDSKNMHISDLNRKMEILISENQCLREQISSIQDTVNKILYSNHQNKKHEITNKKRRVDSSDNSNDESVICMDNNDQTNNKRESSIMATDKSEKKNKDQSTHSVSVIGQTSGKTSQTCQADRTEPNNKESVLQKVTYAAKVSVNNILNSKEFANTRKIGKTNNDGQIRIQYDKRKEIIQNEGYIVSNGTKRHKKNRGKSIMGAAISEVKSLRAQSRPYSYYTGRWSRQTGPEAVVQWVSRFAKVIDYEELSTHIPSRQFRSYKIIVESYSDEAMWNPKNWPGGIIIERFFERKRTKGTNETYQKERIENDTKKQEESPENVATSTSDQGKDKASSIKKLRVKKFDSTKQDSPNESILSDENEKENNEEEFEDIADKENSQLTEDNSKEPKNDEQ